MTDWASYALFGRVLERLMVVFFAGMSVYLGHRLFLQIPNVRDSQGQVKLPAMNMTVKVSRIGPGVFFALFGVAVLLTSFLHPVSIETTKGQSVGGDSQQESKFIGANPTQSEQDQSLRRSVVAEAIRSLNSITLPSLQLPRKAGDRDPLTAIRDTKLVLMDLIWDSAWGDAASFKEVVLKGPPRDDRTVAPKTQKALAFFLQTEVR